MPQRGSVIQGSFPHGLTRFTAAQNQSARPMPDWVQQRSRQGSIRDSMPAQPKRMAAPAARTFQASPNGTAVQLPPSLTHRLPAAGGEALPGAVRQRMEAVFGANFSDVRIHVGAEAAAMGATAVTQGSHIYFAPGHYEPNTLRGQQILGHELTHVVQQRAGRVRNPFGSGVAVVHEAALEAEAERMGCRVAADELRASARPAARTATSATPFHARSMRSGHGLSVQMLKGISQVVPPGEAATSRDALARYIRYLIAEAQVLMPEPGAKLEPDAKFDPRAAKAVEATMQLRYLGMEVRDASAKDIGDVEWIWDMRMKIAARRWELEELLRPSVVVAAPPAGYTAVTKYGKTVYLADTKIALGEVALTHLVQGGAMGIRGSGGFHSSDKITGATKDDLYLHPSKGDPTLYLIAAQGAHGAIPKFAIAKVGRVNKGHHYF